MDKYGYMTSRGVKKNCPITKVRADPKTYDLVWFLVSVNCVFKTLDKENSLLLKINPVQNIQAQSSLPWFSNSSNSLMHRSAELYQSGWQRPWHPGIADDAQHAEANNN